jgi:hypothetical protein
MGKGCRVPRPVEFEVLGLCSVFLKWDPDSDVVLRNSLSMQDTIAAP